MAEANRPPLQPALTREQRLADTLVRRYGLEPPVDVHGLAEEFADVEHDLIPGDCDGLVVGLDGRTRTRPLIILTHTTNVARERFTVAHELGHVLLPWHGTATLACDVQADLSPQAYISRRAETEANRFAADLLVPPGWLSSLLDAQGLRHMSAVIGAIRLARVSAHVACLSLSRQLPAGHVFAILDEDGRVALVGASPDTAIDLPPRGSRLTTRLDRFADSREVFQFGSRDVVWWTFARSRVGSDDDARTAKEVLASLLDRHVQDSARAHAIRASFGGIVGSANNGGWLGRRYTEDELYERLRRAFTKSRDVPGSLLDDPEFLVWMRKRAREVAA